MSNCETLPSPRNESIFLQYVVYCGYLTNVLGSCKVLLHSVVLLYVILGYLQSRSCFQPGLKFIDDVLEVYSPF